MIIGFINVFPDQSAGGYPGSNFGNACAKGYYTINGQNTTLLSSCRYIGPDITTCQNTYGKKVLLSLGGARPTNQWIANDQSAVNFANFLWSAFGPQPASSSTNNIPRPFGSASVNGFDFDIESSLDTPPTYNGQTLTDYKSRGYAKMIYTLRHSLFTQYPSRRFYISGAPQCVVPDAHLGTVVTTAYFDFLFIQFYNTNQCSARAAITHASQGGKNDISYTTWSSVKFYNKNIKLYLGLSGSPASSSLVNYHLSPKEANTVIRRFYSDSKFGGVMLWEATSSAENVVCGLNYIGWMKKLLNAVQNKKTINTNTNDCRGSGSKTCGTCPAMPKSNNGRCGSNFGTVCNGTKYGSCCRSVIIIPVHRDSSDVVSLALMVIVCHVFQAQVLLALLLHYYL